MQPTVDSWTIVVAGLWNPAIFRPEWLRGRATDADEVGIELPFGAPGLPTRMRFDDVWLRVGAQRLVLGVDDVRDETLTRIERIAVRLLTDLPHTPVSATGVNFGFRENVAPESVMALFRFADTRRLSDARYRVGVASVKRALVIDGVSFNLTVELREDGSAGTDFNFHRQVPGTDQAVQHLQNNVVAFKNRAVAFLHDVYGLELE